MRLWTAMVACLLLATSSFGANVSIDHVTTNGRSNPLGIPAKGISFGWSAVSPDRGVLQTAYEIHVGSQPGLQDIWSSGQVASSRQVDVALPPLVSIQPSTRYHWQVRTWDQEGQSSGWSEPAWFETGLLSEPDWAGAEWISRPVVNPNPADWSNYTASINFTLLNTALGVFLRSSMDAQNAYMFQINVSGANPVLKPHKRTNGAYTVLSTINLASFGFTNASFTGTTNTLEFTVTGNRIITRLNGTKIDDRTDNSFANGFVGFRTYGSEAGAIHRMTVVTEADGKRLADPDFSRGENGFSGGYIANSSLQVSGTTDAVFANLPASLPLLRGEFTAGGNIVSARLYASAKGIYEASINGHKVGDQFLAPGWTDYNKRIQSQTYDITSLVQPGANVIGAALADGWFKGSIGLNWTNVYGSKLAFIGKIKITYADGTIEWHSTGATWKAGDSPFIQGDLQKGEIYHAGLEQPGWNSNGYDDSSWSPVEQVTNDSAKLIAQPDEPAREKMVLTATSRTEILPGRWIYDLGQNMVGVARVRLTGTTGQAITIRHGEELYRTGTLTGQLYTDNLRTASATDTYTFASNGTVIYQPRFTQHGFRYIEITGTSTPPASSEVQGVAMGSDLAETGDLETSNTMLNRLVSNIRWGQRSNFLSIPTDTPARDERLGWSGDISVFTPTACRYMDTRAFLSKWMDDVRDSQTPNGNIPAVVPRANGTFDATGVGWADAVITVPYHVWRASGDERIIRDNWNTIKSFYQFVHNSATADGDLLEQGRSSWFSGDWLYLEPDWNRLEEHKVIATAYFAEDTRMMSEMAQAMGESTLASQWSALVPRIREAFANAYRNPDGTIYQKTQTAYALTLGMDMIADPIQRNLTATKFIDLLASDNHHLQTGFLGTPWLLPALSKIGRNDLAMRLLLNEDYPSWGFPISMGATTMWERWNSIQPNGSFGPVDMNSFNHYAYGAVGDWMFGNLGGIQEEQPGYKVSRIAPLIGPGNLGHGRCEQRTSYGRLATEWSFSAGAATLHVDVPVNTTAVVHLTGADEASVRESGTPADTVPGVKNLGVGNGARIYEIGSGSYTFNWTPVPGVPVIQQARAEPGRVFLKWSNELNATGYDIKRSMAPGGPYTVISRNLAETSHLDSGLLNGMTYYYVVSARNPDFQSRDSAEASVRPGFVPDGSFEQPVTGSYLYNPTGGKWIFTSQSGVATNNSLFTRANPPAPDGTQVSFLQGTGSASQVVEGLVPGTAYLISFDAAQRATGPSWNTNGQTWNITIDNLTIGSFSPLQSPTSYTSYSAPFTATASTHTLKLTGTNSRGGDNTVFIDRVRVVAASPAAPMLQNTATGHESITLSWEAVANASGYLITRSAAGVADMTFTVSAPAVSFTDHGLANGTSYTYTVSSFDTAGVGPPSLPTAAIPTTLPISDRELLPPSLNLQPDGSGGFEARVIVPQSVPGHAYTLFSSDNLGVDSWKMIPDSGTQSGNGGDLYFVVPVEADARKRFFRILVED